MIKVHQTEEFKKWLKKTDNTNEAKIRAGARKIEIDGNFGDHKYLSDGIWELRWKFGLRVYYGILDLEIVLLTHGGFKDGQKRDIEKAKKIIKKYS